MTPSAPYPPAIHTLPVAGSLSAVKLRLGVVNGAPTAPGVCARVVDIHFVRWVGCYSSASQYPHLVVYHYPSRLACCSRYCGYRAYGVVAGSKLNDRLVSTTAPPW